MTIAQEATCPACGYSRMGIASEALCPECGADGLAGCVVLIGVRRTSESALLPIFAFAVFALLFLGAQFLFPRRALGGGVVATQVDAFHVFLFVSILISSLIIGYRIFGRANHKRSAEHGPKSVVWIVHPSGIEIRERTSRVFIAREEISRIACADSLIGAVSQLQLIRRRSSLGGVVGTTPVLYLRGSKDDRWSRWREAREMLGLPL